MWNKLSMKDRAEYIKLGVANGITSLDEIRSAYNQYAEGGHKEDKKSDNEYVTELLKQAKQNFTLNVDKQKERLYNHFDPYSAYTDDAITRAFELIIGGPEFAKHQFDKRESNKKKFPFSSKNEYYEGAQDPLTDAIWAEYLGIPNEKRKYKENPIILEKSKYKPTIGAERDYYYKLPLDEGTIQEIVNTGSYLKPKENKNTKILFNYNMGTSTIGRGRDSKGDYVSYSDTWDINPMHGDYVSNKLSENKLLKKLFYNKGNDIFRGITNPLPFYDRIYLDEYYDVPEDKRGGYYLPEVTVFPTGNLYAEGGLKDSWKPQYWFTHRYNTPTLKEAIFKAYDDGRKGEIIMWDKRAYKALLDPKDTIEWQHHANKRITDEDVVNSYIDNVLYVMENPNNTGFKRGKYYPYADSSSPKNIGPGINYTSDLAKGLDFSGKTGYKKDVLDELVRADLMKKMEGINSDLHNMYGERADTMSLGNRMILLDIAHNVRPKGKKRANMPKKWPSLVSGMMSGSNSKARKNTNSGSTRRQKMRNDLLWQNIIDPNTVKNR